MPPFSDFYDDLRYCPACARYVQYLQSIEHSYCAQCRAEVKLFSDGDMKTFRLSDPTLRGRDRWNDDGETPGMQHVADVGHPARRPA